MSLNIWQEFINGKEWQWIFSGIGIPVSYGLYKFLKPKKKPEIKHETIPPQRTDDAEHSTPPHSSLVTAKDISGRMCLALDLINENSRNPKTISEFAIYLGLTSPSELESYLKSLTEPAFPFLEKFSVAFGINYHWLTSGKGQPFRTEEKYELFAHSYIGRVRGLKPQTIYFVMCDSEIREAGIVCVFRRW